MDKTLLTRRDARIGVTMPTELRKRLDAAAAAENMHISTLVRLALVEYLQKLEATRTQLQEVAHE